MVSTVTFVHPVRAHTTRVEQTGLLKWAVILCKCAYAYIGRERALEIATEYIENAVRRATDGDRQ